MKKLVLSLLFFLSFSTFAGIGSVTELTGQAIIKRAKTTIPISKGTVIEQNDTIETKNGKLKIVFQDDTNVTVTEHSSLLIDEFVFDGNGKGKLGLKATSGTVRYVSGAIAKDPKQVKINTPTAAIAVRGTDFVMSVNEIGSSMIILMPSCESESSLKGSSCTTGAIDVQSGPNSVSMNRPYQATLVESAGQPPTPPITVNLFNTSIGNNLQITPPRTMGGANVIAAARTAAAATNVTRENKREAKEEKEDKDDGKDAEHKTNEKNNKSASKDNSKNDSEQDDKALKEIIKTNSDALANNVGAVVATDNPYLKKLFKDKSETQQIGWLYESLSPNNKNYASIVLQMSTQVQVVVTQDMQTNSFIFGSSKPIGQIVITQSYK